MEAAAYHSLRKLQDRHCWFARRRAIVARMIQAFSRLPERPRILEVGCGNLAMLAQFGDLGAFELDDDARAYASLRAPRQVAPGLLPDRVGIDGERFDLIAMLDVLDVLEHVEDDFGALLALRQRLGADGSILITVPALLWLWSAHDAIHHHKRRYTRTGLDRLLRRAGYATVSISYFNGLLFPPTMMQRLAAQLKHAPRQTGHPAGAMARPAARRRLQTGKLRCRVDRPAYRPAALCGRAPGAAVK